jgi:hypothetical protein
MIPVQRLQTGVRAAGATLHAAALLAVAACILYGISIVVGIARGFYFPVAAVFDLVPWTAHLVKYERSIAYLVLLYALVGAGVSWIADGDAFRERERRILLLWERTGFFVVAALFLLFLGITWRGVLRERDLTYFSLAGLAPYSDAYNYFQATFVQVATGTWEAVASRRPYAAAQRSTLMLFSGYSSIAFLIVQALLLAGAVYFAVRAVMRWRGVWAGLTFFGLTLLLIHNYLPTHLTEPFGIFWALVAIPFAIDAMRTRSPLPALACLFAICIALFTRMGSMFTIPLFAIWLTWIVRHDRRAALRTAAAATGLILFCVAFNTMLLIPYGAAKGGGAGGNFAYTACGLAHGGDWHTCPTLYAAELDAHRSDEAAQVRLLYHKAFVKMKSQPLIVLHRLVDAERLFVTELPRRMLAGYPMDGPADWFPTALWYVCAAAGIFFVLRRRRAAAELSFWVVMLGSIAMSAPFIIYDDGWRVISTSLPFIALFLATGFSTPATYTPATNPSSSRGVAVKLAIMAAAMLMFLVMPAVATRADVPRMRELSRVPVADGQVLVLARKGMSGFLVVSDGTPVPRDVPAIAVSNLRRMLTRSGIAADQQPPSFPKPPFSVVVAIEPHYYSGRFFVGPAELIQRRDAVAWKLSIEDWTPAVDSYWDVIRTATPVLASSFPH